MALLDDIKLFLRISHNLLDNEIQTVIASAREELKRAGVKAAIAESQDAGTKELVEQAIKTYAKAYYAEPKDAEQYNESFKYQLDNLRKTYPEGVNDV
jgi:uncharacterized phage protein (predicted DNA packaging)